MTRVCLVGSADCDLRSELLSRQTAREALATYQLECPYANTVAVETISLGVAVSFCNDLSWYLSRYADAAIVLEPSISATEWLSHALATAVRDGDIDAQTSTPYLKVYGVETDENAENPRLVEPMYTTRTAGAVPEYDLREVDETLVVRITESEC